MLRSLAGRLEELLALLRRDPTDPSKLDAASRLAFHYLTEMLHGRRLLRGADRVDEVAQRVCVRMFVTRIDHFLRKTPPLVAYLTTAAKNEAKQLLIQERRFWRRRKLIPPPDIRTEHDGDIPVPQDPWDHLAFLPRRERQVVLRRREGVRFAAIALELGTTPGAARMCFLRAKKHLWTLLHPGPSVPALAAPVRCFTPLHDP